MLGDRLKYTHISHLLMCSVLRDRLNMAKATQCNENKQFKLELTQHCSPLKVDETSIRFGVLKDYTLEPGKSVRFNTGFFIHQKGNYVIQFEPLNFYTSLQLLPTISSNKTVGHNFTLINHGEFPISIPVHKHAFKSTFIPLEDSVDIIQDLPMGPGLKHIEEHLECIHSMNFYDWKDAQTNTPEKD